MPPAHLQARQPPRPPDTPDARHGAALRSPRAGDAPSPAATTSNTTTSSSGAAAVDGGYGGGPSLVTTKALFSPSSHPYPAAYAGPSLATTKAELFRAIIRGKEQSEEQLRKEVRGRVSE